MPDYCEDRDYSLDDDPLWFCKVCGSRVVHHFHRGRRPYMARFAEPDEEWWTCPNCGELYEDEVTETVPEES